MIYKTCHCKYEIVCGDSDNMAYIGCQLKLGTQNDKCRKYCINYEIKKAK